MDEHQLRFLSDEFFSLTLMATVQMVAGAKAAAKGVPLPVWELLTYNNAQGVAADPPSAGR